MDKIQVSCKICGKKILKVPSKLKKTKNHFCCIKCLRSHQQREERIYEHIEKKDNGCWEWTGAKTPKGYGSIRCEGKTLCAHRVLWKIHNGEIPKGMFLCHRCDNPACCNPSHLFLGTHRDNMNDMVKKGRSNKLKGELHKSAKLTEKNVLDIREEYKKGNISYSILAKKYSVTKESIYAVVKKKSWKHI